MPHPKLPYYLEIPSLTLLEIILCLRLPTHQHSAASRYTSSTDTQLIR